MVYMEVLFLLPLLGLLSVTAAYTSEASTIGGPLVKSATFLSPPFFLRPGSVENKVYLDIPFPRGHIALKSFDAEVVDEDGVPVPLHETYLHHWVVDRYHGENKPMITQGSTDAEAPDLSKILLVPNSGLCDRSLRQYYGLGSETRKTATWVPDPYGIEVGDPSTIPEGFQERWLLNVHAIDTRGVEDRLGCTECRCRLYNVTVDEYGRPLPRNYTGGLNCCYDQTQCRVREGFEGATRKLFLKYTVMWVDWDVTIRPVKIYILDVTDTGKPSDESESRSPFRRSGCKVEYEVKACSSEDRANGECVDVNAARLALPTGGDIVYGVAHQHTGGIGSALYGQDGRLLCTSFPTYGEGKEAGNEVNYIVGMSTCYPEPGSVKVVDGEILTLVSNYSSTQLHSGVMGLFYILVAEPHSEPRPEPEPGQKTTICLSVFATRCFEMSMTMTWVLLAAVLLALAIGISYCVKKRREGYQYFLIR